MIYTQFNKKRGDFDFHKPVPEVGIEPTRAFLPKRF